MMLAIAASKTSAENGNRPQPNSLEKVFNNSDSGYESLRQFIKPNLMESFIGTDTASVELFFNIFTSRIETFVIPWNQLLYPVSYKSAPGIGTILWNSSPHLWHSKNDDTDRTGISWGVRKDGPQLSMLTPCALLCVHVSVTLAPTWRTIFWTRAPWQFCVTRRGK